MRHMEHRPTPEDRTGIHPDDCDCGGVLCEQDRLDKLAGDPVALAACCADCDDDNREFRLSHVLLTPQTCPCDKQSDYQCQVCDGGLAVCAKCGKFEAGLDEPCDVRQGRSEGLSDEAPDHLAGKDCRTLAIPAFTSDWEQAPPTVRRLIERNDAEYFWLKGQQAGRLAEQRETRQWLQKMMEGYEERTR